MAPSEYETTTVDFDLGRLLFRATGSRVLFDGFRKLYQEGHEPEENADPEELAPIPKLAVGDVVTLRAITPSQHFTEPPPRYSQASLVKALEEKGIGRPSTYATIIGTLQDRWYATTKDRRFSPTPQGEKVWKAMRRCFPEVFEVGFTAQMETELDKVEEGELEWVAAVRDFYRRFQPHVAKGKRLALPPGLFNSGQICDKCGSEMVVKWTKRGPFLGCSAYPKCRNTKPLFAPGEEPDLDEKCPRCGAALVAKSGRFGPFVACENAPDCSYSRSLKAETVPEEPTGEKCPNCGSPMIVKTGRFGRFVACSNYPACKTTKPIGLGLPCPKDGGELVERRTKRGKVFYGCANYPACDFAVWNRPVAIDCPHCHAKVGEETNSRRAGPAVRCLTCRETVEAAPAPAPAAV
jgi:DNA topoisomerase-1